MALSKTVVQKGGVVAEAKLFPPLTEQELEDIRYPSRACVVAARRYPKAIRHTKAAKLQRMQDLATWMRVCSRPEMQPTGVDPKTGFPLYQDEQGRNLAVPIPGGRFKLTKKSLCRLYEEHAPHALPEGYFDPKSRKGAIANTKISTTLLIQSPGIVKISDDLEFNPTNPNTTAILIQNVTSSRGVLLKGNGYSLSQASTNTKTGVVGIGISNSTNVTIEEFRSISDFSLAGIVTSRSATGTTNGLTIHKCNILNNGPPYTGPVNPPVASLVSGGILLDNVQGVTLSKVIVEGSAGFALGVNAVTGLQATQSRFDRSRSLAGTFPFGSLACGAFGFIWPFTPPFTQPSLDLVFEDCTFSNHSGDDTVLGIAICADPSLQMGVGAGGFTRVNRCDLISNIQTNPNPSMPGFLTGIACGLSVYAVGGTVDSCNVVTQTNVATVGFENQGIQSVNTDVTFRKCKASGISGSSFIEALCGIGIDLAGTSCLLEDCEVENVVNSLPSLQGQPESACGFFISEVIYHDFLQQSRSITVKNCTASNVPNGPGFWTSGVIGGVTKGCVSTGNKGGFLVADVYTDKAITRNLVFSSNVADNNSVYGFKEILAGEDQYFNNIYESNWAHLNGVDQQGGATANNYVFTAQLPDISNVYGQTFTDSYPKNFSSSLPTSTLPVVPRVASASSSTAIVRRDAQLSEEERLMLLISEHKALVELETTTKKSLNCIALQKSQLAITLREQLLAQAEQLKNY